MAEIGAAFAKLFPFDEHDDLAERITDYWIEKLRQVWSSKSRDIRDRDEQYRPSDPLSRIQQKTVLISYADSVRSKGEKSLDALDRLISTHFPAIGGMHLLPACKVAEGRFNDGYFSQVVRDRIHEPFGTDQKFAEMMAAHFSMADFVLNHVDIENPMFQAYLDGDDGAGRCFYVFREEEYRERLKNGDFDQVFRPRPFPLFTIFRRRPSEDRYAGLPHAEKVAEINSRLRPHALPEPVVSLLSVFNKVKNDQMLLGGDYRHVTDFRKYLNENTAGHPEDIFTVSTTQETRHTPYIFHDRIRSIGDLFEALGYDSDAAHEYAETYRQNDPIVFGEEIRALTTFSHVQVDLNTSTYEGLKMLIDDFAWYLSTDLDMLRLDAANFAFKKWGTSCFGLDEVKDIMRILTLSMDAVSPRIVANLEVNDQLGNVLAQMADRDSAPPMMYDFHLASVLPVVFNTGNTEVLSRIFEMIARYDIPESSIRFSLAESHDGKSVRGSLDLLTLAERQDLADTVEANGGKIKYKSVQARQYALPEFQEVCKEAGVDFGRSTSALFENSGTSDDPLYLKGSLRSISDIAVALGMDVHQLLGNGTLKSFVNRLINGREPYELCASTIDSMTRLADRSLETERYLAFYTLAFALMGRNVKSIYFNDLMALPNDHEAVKASGELRDIKRTKSDLEDLEQLLADPDSVHGRITRGMNSLIALVDSDPALHHRGKEAELIPCTDSSRPVAVVHNSYGDYRTVVLVNVGQNTEAVTVDIRESLPNGDGAVFDNIDGRDVPIGADGRIALAVQPYQRMWLTGTGPIS